MRTIGIGVLVCVMALGCGGGEKRSDGGAGGSGRSRDGAPGMDGGGGAGGSGGSRDAAPGMDGGGGADGSSQNLRPQAMARCQAICDNGMSLACGSMCPAVCLSYFLDA